MSCVTTPTELCTDELRPQGRVAAPTLVIGELVFDARRGQALVAFLSKAERERREARRAAVERIARRFRESSELASCKKYAMARGRCILYLDVPTSGTPTVAVHGEAPY